ncbi:MAG: tetratricopeptide repeat protein [Planctomycetes bacterium]|nr:tetratricopeptide repeat protein [Planctomycetota bacterium]
MRENAGRAWRDDLAVLAARGRDAAIYLHAQTTNDVHALAPGCGHTTATLRPKAEIVAVYSLHRLGDDYRIVVDRARKDALLARFEKYHIMEEVDFADLSGELRVLSLQGPRALAILALAFPDAACPAQDEGIAAFPAGGPGAFAVRSTHTGEDGCLLACAESRADFVLDRLLEAGAGSGIAEVGTEALEILRIEAGLPRFGADFDEETILPETGIESRAVSYAKGCYTGQEVIARVKTYGAVGRALLGLRFSGTNLPPPGAAIQVDGKDAGRIASGVMSPSLGAPLAFAYLSRELRAAGRTIRFHAAGRDHEATVLVPPFYSKGEGRGPLPLPTAGTPSARQGSCQRPLPRQRSAARETQDERREDPRSEVVPALQGEAELAQAERALSMFREVLAIDPRDHLASFGLGRGLFELGRPEEALPYLEAAAAIRPDHSIGYVTLGRCLERLGRTHRAREVCEKGIAVATRRGDLLPLEEMQRQLASLPP